MERREPVEPGEQAPVARAPAAQGAAERVGSLAAEAAAERQAAARREAVERRRLAAAGPAAEEAPEAARVAQRPELLVAAPVVA